jgi:outer membrane lipoprotein carrier protein
MTLLALVWLASIVTPVGDPTTPPADAAQLLAAVGRRHRDIRDFEARFVQTYRSGALGKQIVESGTVRLKRPGRMRWDYRQPDEKLFVSDGAQVYFYVPADHQVVVRDQGGDQALAFRLLAGDADLAREFSATLLAGAGSVTRLRLTPRAPDPDVELVILDVDSQYRIGAIEIHDVQGNESRFRFEGVKENRGLPDRVFRFQIPGNAEVVKG